MALGARQQVKNLETGQLSRHYIAEISLNVTLNRNQPLQLTKRKQEWLNTPTSQQNTWTPVPNFIEINM